MGSDNYDMFTMADNLRTLRKIKAETEQELKGINKAIESLVAELVAEMVNEEVSRFDRNDKMFYIRTELYPRVTAERRDVLLDAIREHGFGELIEETIHPSTLSGFIKEQVRDNDGDLPEWLEGLVEIHRKENIAMRQAANKNKEEA